MLLAGYRETYYFWEVRAFSRCKIERMLTIFDFLLAPLSILNEDRYRSAQGTAVANCGLFIYR